MGFPISTILAKIIRTIALRWLRAKDSFHLTLRRNNTFANHLIAIVLLLLVLIAILYSILPPIQLPRDTISEFLLVSITLLAGIVAVLFSVRIIVIQNAFSGVVSGFYRLAVKDRVTGAVFMAMCALMIIALLAQLSLPLAIVPGFLLSANILIPIFVAVYGTVLSLVWVVYRRVSSLSDTNLILNRVEKYYARQIDRIAQSVTRYSRFISLPSNVGMNPDVAARMAAYRLFQPKLEEVVQQIQLLFQYHDRLRSQNDLAASHAALSVVSRLLLKYFDARKESMLITHNLLTYSSDSAFFVVPILESYLQRSKVLIKEDDNDSIFHTLKIFVSLCDASTSLRFYPEESGENPTFDLIQGYLNQIVDYGIAQNHEETLFQATKCYETIGLVAIRCKLTYTISALNSQFATVAGHGLIINSYPVVKQAIQSHCAIVQTIAASDYSDISIQMSSAFEYISLSVSRVLMLKKRTELLIGNRYDDAIAIPVTLLPSLVSKLIDDLSGEIDPLQRSVRFSKLDTILDSFGSFLRGVAKSSASADSMFLFQVGRSIKASSKSLLRSKEIWNTREEDAVLKHVDSLIYVPSWYIASGDRIDANMVNLHVVNPLFEIGVTATNRDFDKQSASSIIAISHIAINVLKYAVPADMTYGAPRCMLYACLLGIIAMNYGKNDLVTVAKEEVKKFDVAYKEKMFPNDEDLHTRTSVNRMQLLTELLHYQSDLQSRSSRAFLASDREIERTVNDRISAEGIDAFIALVWPDVSNREN